MLSKTFLMPTRLCCLHSHLADVNNMASTEAAFKDLRVWRARSLLNSRLVLLKKEGRWKNPNPKPKTETLIPTPERKMRKRENKKRKRKRRPQPLFPHSPKQTSLALRALRLSTGKGFTRIPLRLYATTSTPTCRMADQPHKGQCTHRK